MDSLAEQMALAKAVCQKEKKKEGCKSFNRLVRLEQNGQLVGSKEECEV